MTKWSFFVNSSIDLGEPSPCRRLFHPVPHCADFRSVLMPPCRPPFRGARHRKGNGKKLTFSVAFMETGMEVRRFSSRTILRSMLTRNGPSF